MTDTNIILKPPALPATVTDMLASRRGNVKRTLHDHVEDIHVQLYGSSELYKSYLDAVENSQAVEGSTAADNFSAATMIREKARTGGNTFLGGQNLHTINVSLNVVLRRYRMGRKERRAMVAGITHEAAE